MVDLNPEIMRWARETAGLSMGRAAAAIGLKDTRRARAVDRLEALESGQEEPKRNLLAKMAEKYRRPLITFYLERPPGKADRGQDFRSVPDRETGMEALVDALLRDVRARQDAVRDYLSEDEDHKALSFIGSFQPGSSDDLVRSITDVLKLNVTEFRHQKTPEKAFAFLRSKVEDAGVFVLLLGNLGSHHTAISVEAFRGFALADPIAPFIVINDQDAVAAWSFTLIHELAHLWLGASGVSGRTPDLAIEKFCNDVAALFLLPRDELPTLGIGTETPQADVIDRINNFADAHHVSRSMVAYALYRQSFITEKMWRSVVGIFLANWRKSRDAKRERIKDSQGPNYYVVRRHRLGAALIKTVQRGLESGSLSPTRAGAILGVKPRSVSSLIYPTARSTKVA